MVVTPALPRRVLLGPFVYEVTDDEAAWVGSRKVQDDHWGYTDHRRGMILVSTECTPSMQRTVMLHELLHAAAFTGGQHYTDDMTEEQFVTLVTPMLLDSLRRSPGLAEFLLHAEDEGA